MTETGKTVSIISGTRCSLTDELMDSLTRFRYRVFVKMLGWNLPCSDEQELDQFDRPDTIYLVARQDAEVVGTARLLPTHRPYLLGEIFPQLMHDQPIPNDPAVWELSRFTAVNLGKRSVGQASRQFSSRLAVQLLHSVLELAAEHRIQRLITVSPLGVERLLQRARFSAYRAGPTLIIGGHPLFACWIDVPQTPMIELTREK